MLGSLCGKMEFMSGSRQIRKYYEFRHRFKRLGEGNQKITLSICNVCAFANTYLPHCRIGFTLTEPSQQQPQCRSFHGDPDIYFVLSLIFIF